MSINKYKFEITEEKNNTRLDSALANLIPEIRRTELKILLTKDLLKLIKFK